MFFKVLDVIKRPRPRPWTSSRGHQTSTALGSGAYPVQQRQSTNQRVELSSEEERYENYITEYITKVSKGLIPKLSFYRFLNPANRMISNNTLLNHFLSRIPFMLGEANKVSAIDISNLNLGNEGLNKLAEGLNEAKSVNGIVEVNISGNNSQFMQTNLPKVLNDKMKNIQILELGNNNISENAHSTDPTKKPLGLDFVQFLKEMSELQNIHLNNASLNKDDMIDLFAEYLENAQNIKTLNIANNDLNDKQLAKILRAISNRNMKALDFSGNEFGEASNNALKDVLQKSASTLKSLRAQGVIREVKVDNNLITDSLFYAQSPKKDLKVKLPALIELDLSGNHIKDSDIKPLIEKLVFSSLKKLILDNNLLTLNAVMILGNLSPILRVENYIEFSLHNIRSLDGYPDMLGKIQANWQPNWNYTFDLSNNNFNKNDLLSMLWECGIGFSKNFMLRNTKLYFKLDGCNMESKFASEALRHLQGVPQPQNPCKITVDFGGGYTPEDANNMTLSSYKNQYVPGNLLVDLIASPKQPDISYDIPAAPIEKNENIASNTLKPGLFSVIYSWFAHTEDHDTSEASI